MRLGDRHRERLHVQQRLELLSDVVPDAHGDAAVRDRLFETLCIAIPCDGIATDTLCFLPHRTTQVSDDTRRCKSCIIKIVREFIPLPQRNVDQIPTNYSLSEHP